MNQWFTQVPIRSLKSQRTTTPANLGEIHPTDLCQIRGKQKGKAPHPSILLRKQRLRGVQVPD